MENKNDNRKVIKHAAEIFPNAPMAYCIGVNNYLAGNYDERYLYQETFYFKDGYMQAKIDGLEKEFVLKSQINTKN